MSVEKAYDKQLPFLIKTITKESLYHRGMEAFGNRTQNLKVKKDD